MSLLRITDEKRPLRFMPGDKNNRTKQRSSKILIYADSGEAVIPEDQLRVVLKFPETENKFLGFWGLPKNKKAFEAVTSTDQNGGPCFRFARGVMNKRLRNNLITFQEMTTRVKILSR